jgi:hypothetical protein
MMGPYRQDFLTFGNRLFVTEGGRTSRFVALSLGVGSNQKKRFMRKHLWLVACLLAGSASAATWSPNDELLQAIRSVESAAGQYTWGDEGRSLGDFQLSEGAWFDVNVWRKARGLPTYDYQQHVWSPRISRIYAAEYMRILARELQRRLSRPPTPAEVYAAYNMGLSSFAQCHYKLAKVNPTTARKCELIRAMLEGH